MHYTDIPQGPALDYEIYRLLNDRPIAVDHAGYCDGQIVAEDLLYCDSCDWIGPAGGDPGQWANAHKPVVPQYSRDPAAALELAEAIRDLGHFVEIELQPHRTLVAIYRGPSRARGEVPVAALSSDQPFATIVARAASAALEVFLEE